MDRFRIFRNEKLVIITIIVFIFIFYQVLLIDNLSNKVNKETIDKKQIKTIEEFQIKTSSISSSSYEEEFCEIDKIEECLSND